MQALGCWSLNPHHAQNQTAIAQSIVGYTAIASSTSEPCAMTHAAFMQAAIAQARQGLSEGGIPIGCVIVRNNEIVAQGYNRRVQHNSAIHHGEMNALENLGRQPADFYADVTLYTTLSPCSMCTGAILLYKIPHVVIGENQTFRGDEALLCSRGVTLDILDDSDCIQLMTDFIRGNPGLWFEDIGVESDL